MTGAPKAKARANTSPTASHSDPSEPHDGLTTNRTSNRHLVSHRIPTGNNRHHGRHPHSNNSGNPTLHLHPLGHPIPDHRTRIPRDTSLRAKGGRRANRPPAGNRDNTERRPQRLRRPRCPASNSCSSPSHQTNPSSTSASLTALAQHHKHSSS